jgi:probable LLM family oxidoreductase
MQLGIASFVENTRDPATGALLSPQQRLADLLEEIQLADQLGLDVFAVGEHHRPDFVASSPTTILAAAAVLTKNIRLSTAVTVLSSEEPVRVFEQFATLDLLSNGRAEIMAGRGSFIESFPLFGLSLDDYDTLFAEKLEFLLKIRESEKVTWPGGQHTPPLNSLGVYPRPVQNPLPVWVAVGGTPQSVVRAGVLGLPLAIAIIGGDPEQFVPFVELYHRAFEQSGHDPKAAKVSINSHGFIAEDQQAAAEIAFPPFHQAMTRIGRERGWGPQSRAQFDASYGPRGANFIGGPQEVIEKILLQHEWFKHDRFTLQMTVGSIPHAKVMKSIELYGTVVAPAVRKALGTTSPSA